MGVRGASGREGLWAGRPHWARGDEPGGRFLEPAPLPMAVPRGLLDAGAAESRANLLYLYGRRPWGVGAVTGANEW